LQKSGAFIMIRRVLFWTHLAAGVLSGAVIAVMSLTGVLLAFERQITMWADRQAFTAQAPDPGRPWASLQEILGRMQPAPSAITLRSDAGNIVEATYGRERRRFIDARTGAGLGDGAPRVHAFFDAVQRWHRWLGADASNRGVGRAVTGACNLVFLVLIITGPFLWLPRKMNWERIRAVLLFRSGLSGRARDWNWHHVAGIWSAAPLLVVALTGAVMSYGWATRLLYEVTGTKAPQRAPSFERRSASVPRNVDALLERVKREAPDWKTITMQLPGPHAREVLITADTGGARLPHDRMQFTLDRATASVMRAETFADYNAGRKLRTLARFLHTGEAGGWWGQGVAAAASAGAVLLAWTGFSLAWRRLRSWRARRSESREPVGAGVA
jgi:uncharacterized iron-regulated membrane protein